MDADNNWIGRKARLKKEICDYFYKVNPDMEAIKNDCLHIKKWGQAFAEVNFEPGDQKTDSTLVDADDDCVVNYFSPEHREKVADWINRYAILIAESLQYMESQRTWNQSWARDDFEDAEYQASLPGGEIQVHSDRLVLLSFSFVEGFAQKLPQEGKKSVGKLFFSRGGYEWNYPISSLEQLKQVTGFPTVYSIDSAQDIQEK